MRFPNSRVFALTGSIGSGKSSVSAIFSREGVRVVCADEVAHQVVEPGTPALAAIVEVFGPDVLFVDGSLNRRALGQIVFNDTQAREQLNSIVHPRVRQRVQARFAEYSRQGADLICYDIPLLFETHQEALFRPVVVVRTPRAQVIERVMRRDNLSLQEVESRLASQMSLEEKCKRADFIIDNSGTLPQLKEASLTVLQAVRSYDWD